MSRQKEIPLHLKYKGDISRRIIEAIIDKLYDKNLFNSLFESGECGSTITDPANYTFYLDGLTIDELSHFSCDEGIAADCYLVKWSVVPRVINKNGLHPDTKMLALKAGKKCSGIVSKASVAIIEDFRTPRITVVALKMSEVGYYNVKAR